MDISTEAHSNGVTVIVLKGRMIDEDAFGLRQVVSSAFNSGVRGIIIDMFSVPFIDSLGVGEVVRIHKEAKQSGQAFALCCLTTKVLEHFGRTRLIPELEVYDTRSDALTAFRKRL